MTTTDNHLSQIDPAESEQELRLGLQVAGLALARFDYTTNLVKLSPEAAVMYGFSVDELEVTRDRLHDTFHPDERAELEEIIQRVLDPAGVGWFAREHRIVWPNGEVRWLNVRKQVFFTQIPTPGEDSSAAPLLPHYAVLAAVDITDRKQTEIALEMSERRFSAIFDQTFEFLGLISLDGVVQEVNQAALNSIAAQKSDVVGKSFWKTPWWTHSQQLQQQLRESISRAAQGEFIRYEVQFPSGSGEIMMTDFSLKPVRNEVGRVIMLIAEGYDITERKRTEAALIESEQRFRTLADNISQLAWMADATGGIFWYNRRWFDYTGTTLTEMQGWGWQQVHHPEHLDRVVDRFRSCLEAGQRWEDTFPLRGHDGTYRWFLSRAIPISDAQGNIICWFGTNTDITNIKQAQADLEERNRELDSFVHVVSHDLKAPLRAVANISTWIEEDLAGSITPDTQEQMTLLRSRVVRMQSTIDGLLEYARIGKTEGTIEEVEISELIRETLDSLAPPPTFQIVIDPNLPTLNINRLQLFQVFTNLIGNAIKHHDRLDGTVRISCIDRSDCYEFAVSDDGPGIAPEDRDRMFVIFQANNPQNRSDSTGIGLAIVKKIVESEGGTISLESQFDSSEPTLSNRGATFYFTWPK